MEIIGEIKGRPVHQITIKGGGLTATFLTYGAILQDLRLEQIDHSLVLGFAAFENYLAHRQYFGATVGRYANRIANGRFSIGQQIYQLDCNEAGRTHLHGGAHGLSERLWTIENITDNALHLSIQDQEKETHYPGQCRIDAHFSLQDKGILRIIYKSQSDTKTIANIAHHSYFNLDGTDDILNHKIQIAADHYLPVDERLIPNGEIKSVTETPFDFRLPRAVTHHSGFSAYDHNFCLSAERRPLREIVRAWGRNEAVEMCVHSTEPGLQFYTGQGIQPVKGGLDGKAYGRNSGFCLETQNWPDAPNQSTFPSAILMPDDQLVQETVYQFTRFSDS